MGKIYVIGGIANEAMKDAFKTIKEVGILGTFYSVSQLTEEVIQKGVSFLQAAKAILIIDYGFSQEHHIERAKEFVLLQDVLRSSNLQHTKLYLATKDSNLYVSLQKQEDGIPSILYLHTEVHLLRGEYVPKVLNNIIQGKHDRTGLYHPDVVRLGQVHRMEDDRDKFIQDSKIVDDDILNYGKLEPITPFSQKDYVDSPYSQTQAVKREQEQRKEERKENTAQKSKKVTKPKVSPQEDVVVIHTTPTPSPITEIKTATVAELKEGAKEEVRSFDLPSANIARIRETFQKKLRETNLSDKLVHDSGVLFVTGTAKSGASGILANMAEIYAMHKRTVLVIDLDIENRMQLQYFPKYLAQVARGEGVANSLLQVFRGGAIPLNANKLTNRIHMLGVSPKEKIEEDWWDTLVAHLPAVIQEAKSLYDMVLVDIPFLYLPAAYEVLPHVDKFMYVMENKSYHFDTFLHRSLLHLEEQVGAEMFTHVLRNLVIWVNQFRETNVDKHGTVINKSWIRTQLHKLGKPYDSIQISGESPFYDDWEQQFQVQQCFVWQDQLALEVFKHLMTKVVW